MRARPPVVAALAVAVSLCLFAVAACSGGGGRRRYIPPPPETVAPITTAPPGSDFTNVALDPVAGKAPVEPVKILGGEATLSGVIAGPGGPVAGATVRLERFVGDATARLDVVSNADGTWRAPALAAPPPVPTVPAPPLPGQLTTSPRPTAAPPPPPVTKATGPQGIEGGRYRVRAWRSPDLALTSPQILFVEGKQNQQLTLQLSRYTGIAASSVSSPDPPILDAVTTVTAVVTTVTVDGDGVVRSAPLAGASVSLTVGSGWILSVGTASTNGQGRASFQLRCAALGQSPVELTVNGSQVFSLPLRACVAPAPTTTTTTLPFDPNASTTSTLADGPTTITSLG